MPARLLYFPTRKLEVFDYCLNGARSITSVCPAPGEFSAPYILSITDGKPGRERTSSGFLSSKMTNSFQKAKHGSSLGLCEVPPDLQVSHSITLRSLETQKGKRPKDAQRSAWFVESHSD